MGGYWVTWYRRGDTWKCLTVDSKDRLLYTTTDFLPYTVIVCPPQVTLFQKLNTHYISFPNYIYLGK